MTHVDVRQRRGAALFVVTIVIVLVTLSAYGFVVLMQAENRASRIAADRGQVQMVHDSGYEFLRSYAAMSRVERELWAQVGARLARCWMRARCWRWTEAREGEPAVVFARAVDDPRRYLPRAPLDAAWVTTVEEQLRRAPARVGE